MIEGHVGDNPIEPGVEAALKPESVQILVNPHETFLVDVPSILGAMNQIKGQSKYIAIIAPNEVVERQAVSCLGLADKHLLVRDLHRRCLSRISF